LTMKVLNQAETALVLADLLAGKAEVRYARADNHEGAKYVYMTIKVSDSLAAFAHLFTVDVGTAQVSGGAHD
jgi:hypothetical protein